VVALPPRKDSAGQAETRGRRGRGTRPVPPAA